MARRVDFRDHRRRARWRAEAACVAVIVALLAAAAYLAFERLRRLERELMAGTEDSERYAGFHSLDQLRWQPSYHVRDAWTASGELREPSALYVAWIGAWPDHGPDGATSVGLVWLDEHDLPVRALFCAPGYRQPVRQVFLSDHDWQSQVLSRLRSIASAVLWPGELGPGWAGRCRLVPQVVGHERIVDYPEQTATVVLLPYSLTGEGPCWNVIEADADRSVTHEWQVARQVKALGEQTSDVVSDRRSGE